jgi:hypothetical protein
MGWQVEDISLFAFFQIDRQSIANVEAVTAIHEDFRDQPQT